MPCERCGCIVMDYIRDINMVESYQVVINELYKVNLGPRDVVERLKLKRDVLLEGVMRFIEDYPRHLQRELLRDRAIPIDWETGERLEGVENACYEF